MLLVLSRAHHLLSSSPAQAATYRNLGNSHCQAGGILYAVTGRLCAPELAADVSADITCAYAGLTSSADEDSDVDDGLAGCTNGYRRGAA